jgi:outer membrane protein OmpA-like peptidoglycan-associated protein
MTQTQLAFKSEEFSYTDRLANTFRQSTIAQISKYLSENDYTVKGAVPTLLPSICSLISRLEPNSREISKFSALITTYRESLGNYNLNNISIDHYNHLNDIGTNDLLDLFGLNLSTLLDDINIVSGLKQESAFTLLALIFPYILKQVGGYLPKGANFNSSLDGFMHENSEYYEYLLREASPKLASPEVETPVKGPSLTLYFILLALASFFIFTGLSYLSKSKVNYKEVYRTSLRSIEKFEALSLNRLKSLVGSVIKPSRVLKEDEVNITYDPSLSKTIVADELQNFLNDEKLKIKTFVLSSVKFAFGSSVLTEQGLEEINTLVPLLINVNDIHVELSGHTDNSGDEIFNKKISKERAEAVAKVLVDKGIPLNSIQTIGYGSLKPLSTNSTLEGRYINRRIELLIVKKN